MEYKSHQEMNGVALVDLSEEERNTFIDEMEDSDMKDLLKKHRADGVYECYKKGDKTDYCKVIREETERKKREEVETLQQRNQILEGHARQLETLQKEQEERIAKAEARMEKMAGLLVQLIGSQ